VPPWAERLWSLIRQLQGAMDGKANRSGSDTVTWSGSSTFSSAKSITHGLGKAPSEVQITPFGSVWAVPAVTSISATTITVQLQANDTAVNPSAGSQGFSWRVAG